MSLAMIILLPLVAAFGLLYWTSLMSDEEWLLKQLFRLLFFPLLWLSIFFASSDVGLNYSGNAELINELSLFTEVTGYIVFIVGIYYVYVILKEVVNVWLDKKAAKREEKYE